MRTKAGKQNKTLPSGRGPQLCPAGERHGGPFLPVKNKQETQPRGNAGEEYGPGPDAAAKAHVPPEITPCFLPTEDKAACTAVGHRGGGGGLRARAVAQLCLHGASPDPDGTALPGHRVRAVLQPRCCATVGRSPNISGLVPSSGEGASAGAR